MTAPLNLLRTSVFRLSLAYLAIFAAAVIGCAAYIYWNTQVLLTRQFEETIQAELAGLAAQYNAGGLNRLRDTVAERSEAPGANLYLVTDASGLRLAGNLRVVTEGLWNTLGRVQFTYRRPGPGGPENRLAVARVFQLDSGHRLIVGRDIEDMREFQSVVRSAVIWGLAIMALAGIGGGLLVGRRLLTRIGEITAASRAIMAGNMTGRIPLNGSGDELDRLSASLNAMFDRIGQLMTGLREVSDNIAHDLKTPLNRLRNRAEAALRDAAGPSAYREALQDAIDEADDLIRTFDALLSIARLEAGARGANFSDFDAAQIARDAAELYEPVAEEHNLRIVMAPAPVVQIRGERQLVAQALANLLDNAIKYGQPETPRAANGEIHMSVLSGGAEVELTVADNGPGIAAEDRERALRRFVRLEASRSQPGSGLGLSLAAAVARLHGGSVRLEDNDPGLRAVMRLPKLPGPGAGARGEAFPQETDGGAHDDAD